VVQSELERKFRDLQKNFSIEPLLTKEELDAFWVNYGEESIEELNLLLNGEVDNPFGVKKIFCGHRGCGKSTLLAKVSAYQRDNYFTIFFDIRDIIQPSAIDHINILFAIGLRAFIAAEEAELGIPPSMKQDLYKWFASKVEIDLDETGGGIEANLLDLIKLKLKRESTTRTELRKEFERNIEDLVEKLNVIATFIKSSSGKPLLVIVDDLDKISLDTAQTIYRDNINSLIAPNFSIIYTFPIASYRSIPIVAAIRSVLSDPFVVMPVTQLVPQKERRCQDCQETKGIQILQEALCKRLEFAGLNTPDIIDTDVSRDIIIFSGGLLREAIRIVYYCATECIKRAYRDPQLTSTKIDRSALDVVVKKIRLEFEPAIGRRQLELLTATYNNFQPDDAIEPAFLDLLHGLYILEYQNGETWYDVHPIVAQILQNRGSISSVL
jgi:hypothetical protein